MRKFIAAVMFASLVLVVMFAIQQTRARTEAYDKTSRSDIGYAHVSFGNHILSIPLSYRPGTTRYNSKTGYAAYSLSLLLPEFRPASDDMNEFQRVGWHNQLTVLVEHGPHYRPGRDVLTDHLITPWTDLSKYSHVRNGCKIYDSDAELLGERRLCNDGPDEFVANCEIYSNNMYLTAHEAPFPHCRVRETIRDAAVVYDYSAHYADDAVSIDRRLRTLLLSFEDK